MIVFGNRNPFVGHWGWDEMYATTRQLVQNEKQFSVRAAAFTQQTSVEPHGAPALSGMPRNLGTYTRLPSSSPCIMERNRRFWKGQLQGFALSWGHRCPWRCSQWEWEIQLIKRDIYWAYINSTCWEWCSNSPENWRDRTIFSIVSRRNWGSER